jgi:hypothetical protein
MKFTNIVLAAVAATSLMLTGTILMLIQPYASGISNPSLRDAFDEIRADLNSTSQSINQDNICFKSDNCRQSEVGQNTKGNDNSVTGFADQSDNLQQSAPATGSAGLLISVYKVVTCPQGLICPSSGFIIHVTGNNPNPNNFTLRDGQSKQVPIGPGHYLVTEDEPPTPPNLRLLKKFQQCDNIIQVEDLHRRCKITNEYVRPLNPPTTANN